MQISFPEQDAKLLYNQLRTVARRFERYSKKPLEEWPDEMGSQTDPRPEYKRRATFFFALASQVKSAVQERR